MTPRNVLFLILCAFFLAALGLLYNAYFNPISSSGTGLPSTAEPQ